MSRTYKGTKKHAQTALSELLADVAGGRGSVIGSTTLADFLDQWITSIAPSRSPATIRGYRDKVRRIDAKLGRIQLAKLTAHTLDRTYQEWLDEGLSPTTVHHLHGVLSAALNQAVKWGNAPTAVTQRTSPPPLRTTPTKLPTPHMIQQLIAAAEDKGQPVLATAIAIASTTGLRRGELLGLRWEDIDTDRTTLRVRRAIKHDDGPGWVIGPAKAHQERTIALDSFTMDVLSKHRARAETSAWDASTPLDPEGYVLTFDPSATEPMKPDSLGQAFARLCRAENITGVTLHTLRHFSASALLAGGRDVYTVAGRLGHADASTTERVYAHIVDGRDREAADFLGQLMTTAQPTALKEG